MIESPETIEVSGVTFVRARYEGETRVLYSARADGAEVEVFRWSPEKGCGWQVSVGSPSNYFNRFPGFGGSPEEALGDALRRLTDSEATIGVVRAALARLVGAQAEPPKPDPRDELLCALARDHFVAYGETGRAWLDADGLHVATVGRYGHRDQYRVYVENGKLESAMEPVTRCGVCGGVAGRGPEIPAESLLKLRHPYEPDCNACCDDVAKGAA
jgi:hypothetical protein